MRLALAVFFVVLYFTLQRVVVFVPHQFVATRVDDAIAFDPRWTFVYAAVVFPVAWLLGSAVALWRPLLFIFVVCFIAFFVFPVQGPRPDVMANNRAYDLLVRYDRSLNSFPSLHAALGTYAVLFARRVLSKQAVILLALSVVLMLFASLAIKQHYAIDVLAGIVVAIGADRFS